MSQTRYIQHSFASGEVSPRLTGRSDNQRYFNAVGTLENYVITHHGAAERRGGLRFVAEVKDSTRPTFVRRFQFNTQQSYIIEMGDLYFRFYKDGGRIESGGLPVEVATPYSSTDVASLHLVQSADTLYLFHPNHAPRKLVRSSHTNWTLSVVNFDSPATLEQGDALAITIASVADTGTGVKFRASSDTWLAADVGRTIVSGAGRGIIATLINAKEVTVNILDPIILTRGVPANTANISNASTAVVSTGHGASVGQFIHIVSGGANGDIRRVATVVDANNFTVDAAFSASDAAATWRRVTGIPQNSWTLGGSPNATLTPGAASPVQSTITLTAGANAFRSTDVGKFVYINSGIVKITTFTSATSVNGTILRALANTTAATGGTWTMESLAWSSANGFPRTGTFFEGRLYVASTASKPQTIWASAVDDYENFGRGTKDDESMDFTVASPLVDAIQWVIPINDLFIGTFGGTHRMTGGTSGPVTPTNVNARNQSAKGVATAQPVRVGTAILHISRAKNRINELGLSFDENGNGQYNSQDITLLADHLGETNTFVELAYQENPWSTLYVVRSDGTLCTLTYLRDQQMVGWSRFTTGASGKVESVSVIPHWTQPYDAVWVITQRIIGGVIKRYVEYSDRDLNTDSALTRTPNGTLVTSVSGLSHLNGQTVDVVGDDAVQPQKVVSGGSVTLTTAADKVEVGLHYDSNGETLPLALQGANFQGTMKRWNTCYMRFYKTNHAVVNNQEVFFRKTTDPMDKPVPLFTGNKKLHNFGIDEEGKLKFKQDKPLPQSILYLGGRVEVEDV